MTNSVSLTLEIPENWIADTILTTDLFRYGCVGYWARGVWQGGSWLVFECGAVERKPTDEEIELVETSTILPEHWYRIDEQTACEIYAEVVRRYGVKKAEAADASMLDLATQAVLLGELRYG